MLVDFHFHADRAAASSTFRKVASEAARNGFACEGGGPPDDGSLRIWFAVPEAMSPSQLRRWLERVAPDLAFAIIHPPEGT
jgi:hypothetical protein